MKKFTTDEEKKAYIEKYAGNELSIPEKEREYYKALVEEGCEKDWDVALYVKGYSCYGGNILYEEDWFAARDCFLKLVDITGDPQYYNTLGYIYYYGRCNNRVPEYEKAFQYFTVGAANGVIESIYKLSDMMMNGKGCLKHELGAAKLLTSLYRDCKDALCNGDFDCNYADVALRIGGLMEKGIIDEPDYIAAYAYYLEAKKAIDLRMNNYDFYGDSKVARQINEALERILDKLPANYPDSRVIELDNPGPVADILRHSIGADVTIDYSDGRYSFEFDAVCNSEDKDTALICLPEFGYCDLTRKVKFYLGYDAEMDSAIETPYKAFITGVTYDEDNDIWILNHRDVILVTFRSSQFIFEREDWVK